MGGARAQSRCLCASIGGSLIKTQECKVVVLCNRAERRESHSAAEMRNVRAPGPGARFLRMVFVATDAEIADDTTRYLQHNKTIHLQFRANVSEVVFFARCVLLLSANGTHTNLRESDNQRRV